MPAPIVFITTFQIEEGATEAFKEAARRSTAFLEANGPQLLAEVAIDEASGRAHGIQVHADSASILAHWKLSDPHMRDVMQHITTKRVDIYGDPSDEVIAGMHRLSSQGVVITVTPLLAGFARLVPGDR